MTDNSRASAARVGRPRRPPASAAAGVFIIGLASVDFRGVGESVKADVVLRVIELPGLLLIIGVGLYAVVLQGRGDGSRLTRIDPGDPTALPAITGATGPAFFAMVGFDMRCIPRSGDDRLNPGMSVRDVGWSDPRGRSVAH